MAVGIGFRKCNTMNVHVNVMIGFRKWNKEVVHDEGERELTTRVDRERWLSGAVDVGDAAVKYQIKDLGTQGVSR